MEGQPIKESSPMANGLENLMTKTRMMAGLSKARELNDRQLLEKFAGGDEMAFTALVDRYGGLVMAVCQRVLQHTQDAEDAFQATFMVLARKAGKIAWKESVANWLHGVACRISFQIRREKSRRQSREKAAKELAVAGPDPVWSELKPVLDEELARLPARYRIPFILCCLEGKSRDEAAAQLGWSTGSLKGRLERGREMIRSRLARRGLTLSAALAATMVSAAGAKAAVPLTLGLETVRAGMAMLAGQSAGIVSTQALTFAQGAMHAMFMTKLKFAAAVVLTVLTLGLGTGYVTHHVIAGDRAALLTTRQDKRENNQENDGRQNPMNDGDNQKQPEVATAYVPELAELLAQREERKQSPFVNGVVQTVDATKINVLVGRNDPDGLTFDVSKDVKVIVREGRDTKDAKRADVQPKAHVTLILDDAKKVVQTIEIIGARADAGGERPQRDRREDDGKTFRGFVTEIDVAKKTITFQAGGRGEAPTTKTFDLAKDVKVTLRTGRKAQDGKLEDVPVKTSILVKLDDTKKIVQAIEVTISTTASGAVSEIDEKSITLISGRQEVKSATYALSKDTKIQYWLPGARDGRGTPGQARLLKLADVGAKMHVTVQLDDDLKIAQSINVALPQVGGTIGEIDAKKGTLSLKVGRGDDLNLPVSKDARILIEGKAGSLDKVAVGAEVMLILTPDRMQVLLLQTPLPERRRE
jgi:RNA polymerase sigma factor (sigma-70 family)